MFGSYTPIQEVAMPIIASGSNCLITAPTGSGKTEAAVIPLLDKISHMEAASRQGVALLYITPLRALNRDLIGRLEKICSAHGITVSVRHGDTTQSERARQARKAPMLLITTPETLQSILPTKYVGKALGNVKAVIVDEIHELYQSKRGAQLSLALERLNKVAPDFQRIGISATISDIGAVCNYLFRDRTYKVAEDSKSKSMNVSIEMPHTGAMSELEPMRKKFGLDTSSLARISRIGSHISKSKSTIVFANTRQIVESLGSRLIYADRLKDFGGIRVHHSSLDKEDRISTENAFKAGSVKSIVATSSLELGIDVGSVDLVIQYGSPRQALRLAQRVGRSGHTRFGTANGVIIATSMMDLVESVVVSERALEKRFERFGMQEGAADVLCTQVCGIALDTESISADALLRVINGSFLFKDIDKDKLDSLLEFMSAHRLIGFDGKTVTKGSRTRAYYYDHLSVIPDTKRFAVKNIISNKIISGLSERFVTANLDEGSVFITKGLPWKIISIDKDIVSVEPSTDVDAAVPDWEGEDIPVSRDVAHDVIAMLSHEGSIGEARVKVGEDIIKRIGEFSRAQNACYLADPEKVVVETLQDYKIIHTALGTQGNSALARLLAYMISAKTGRSVITKISPYMVLLEVGQEVNVHQILKSVSHASVHNLLRGSMEETELFRYRFINVAKTFGIVERDASLSRSIVKRLIRLYKGTPVYSEAVRDTMNNFYDTESLTAMFKGIGNGSISLIEVKLDSPSPLSRAILESSYYAKELVSPLLPSSEIVGTFVDSLMGKDINLLCTYCGFRFSRDLKRLKEQKSISCPSCRSPMVCTYSDEYYGAVKKRIAGSRLRSNDLHVIKDALKEADMFSTYGYRAAIALKVYGIGPKTAARALLMFRENDAQFFMDLLEEQKRFIRTRKYWTI